MSFSSVLEIMQLEYKIFHIPTLPVNLQFLTFTTSTTGEKSPESWLLQNSTQPQITVRSCISPRSSRWWYNSADAISFSVTNQSNLHLAGHHLKQEVCNWRLCFEWVGWQLCYLLGIFKLRVGTKVPYILSHISYYIWRPPNVFLNSDQ